MNKILKIIFFLLGVSTALGYAIYKGVAPIGPSDYNVGDCMIVSGDYLYKVIGVGKYSLKVTRKTYGGGNEELVIFSPDIKKSSKADCFNLFAEPQLPGEPQ